MPSPRAILLAVAVLSTACPQRSASPPREGVNAHSPSADQVKRELAELESRGYAGIRAEQLLDKLKHRYPAARKFVSEGCAVWALLDAVERKSLVEPAAVEAAVRLSRARIAALKPSVMGTTMGTAMGLGFVETRAILDERKFSCANPDADFGLLDRETAHDLARIRAQVTGEPGTIEEQPPADVRGPAYFVSLLNAKLDRILHDAQALNRKLYAERPAEPFMLGCSVRYLKHKVREEAWAQTLPKDSSTSCFDLIPRLAEVAARDTKLQAPGSLPSERRSYLTLAGYGPMDCVNVVDEALKAQDSNGEEGSLGGMSVLVGVGTETDMTLMVLRPSKVEAGKPGFSTPYVLGMAITYGGRSRFAYFGFDRSSFAKQKFQVTINGPETILWPRPTPYVDLERGVPERDSKSYKVQGVEVTCAPAPCNPDKHTATEIP